MEDAHVKFFFFTEENIPISRNSNNATTPGALAKAIPAIESGMAGSSGFMQTSAAALLRKVAAVDENERFNRDSNGIVVELN